MPTKKEKHYIIENSQLMAEWDWEKNNELGLDPQKLTCGLKTKAWWKCENGHNFFSSISNRASLGRGCPVCAGRYVTKGINDLASIDPLLALEWNYPKNNPLTPYDVSPNSNKKVWWKGSLCGHEWQEIISNRNKGRNCPYCSGHRVLIGFNDLQTTHPLLCKEWDYEKNGNHKPTEFSRGSSFNAWWLCDKGHSFQSKISNRTSLNRGCPFCSGRYVIKGKTDLQTVCPELLGEWDYEKNDILPSEITAHNPKKVWWKGECGHSWKASINSRSRGIGCPYCGHVIINESNCLAVKNPLVAQHWHPTKNAPLSANAVFPASSEKVWWLCDKGHEFQMIVSRFNKGFYCPQCSKELKTSFPEQAFYFYISQIYSDAINRYQKDGFELDIFIPSLNLGIEYDGLLYHTAKTHDKERKKDEYYSKNYIKIIRIKETKTDEFLDSKTTIWHKVSSNYKHLNSAIQRTLVLLGIYGNISVDVDRDAAKIYAMYLSLERDNSITNKFPELLAEWDYKKNGYLNPAYVNAKSNKPIWWICKEKHSFLMSPSKRTTRNQNCPFCAGRYATKENNLLKVNPILCEEWNYEKNSKKPSEYTPVSGQKVWWKCKKCSHEWESSIANRTKGTGCPNCAKIKRKDKSNE